MPATLDQVRSLIDGDYARASALLGATVPVGWPGETEAIEGLPWHLSAMEADSAQLLWRIRFAVETASNRLIGSVNLKGPPTATGDVEIGWGIDRDARGRGFAKEASQAVIDWVFGHEQVRRVIATIPESNLASQSVARRLGMSTTGEMRRGLPLWVAYPAHGS